MLIKYTEQELIEKLVNDLVEPMKKYREARQLKQSDNPTYLIYHFYGKKIKGSEEIGLIIKSKIDTIGVIGGIDLMRKVCNKLEEHSDEEEYHFASIFDRYADRICGWIA